MSTTPTSEDELDDLLWPIISEIVNTPASAFTSNRERISSNVALVKAALSAYIQRKELAVIEKVFELSPKGSFANWKPIDAWRFYERLKAYEQELKGQLTPPPSKEAS